MKMGIYVMFQGGLVTPWRRYGVIIVRTQYFLYYNELLNILHWLYLIIFIDVREVYTVYTLARCGCIVNIVGVGGREERVNICLYFLCREWRGTKPCCAAPQVPA